MQSDGVTIKNNYVKNTLIHYVKQNIFDDNIIGFKLLYFFITDLITNYLLLIKYS